jgi:UDP-glucose 4-epimerase
VSAEPLPSPFQGRRVLVTGAGGFIGRRLLARLAAVPGCDARATARTVPPPEDDLPHVRWTAADLAEPVAVDALVTEVRPDYIVHLAGYVSGARDPEAVLLALRGNLLTTINVLHAARAGVARVVLAGSMEAPRADEVGAVPGSPYAASKWAASLYSGLFHALYGLPAVVLRIFMTYGPGQRDTSKVLPYVILSSLRGEAPLLASGARPVDWVYVEDVIEAIEAACAAPGIEGRSLDVGSGTLVTIREVAERLVGMIDPSIRPRFGALADRPLERPQAADVATTRAAIGWSPRTSLEEGLAKTVEWYRERAASLQT